MTAADGAGTVVTEPHEVEAALLALEDGSFYADHDVALERCRILRAATAAGNFDDVIAAPVDLEAMGELLALHPDSTDVRAVADLGLSVGALTVLLSRSDAYGTIMQTRAAAIDPWLRSGRVPALDDTTRALLQELNRHVVATVGAEEAKRFMPMVGSYMARAAAGWGPHPREEAVGLEAEARA